MPSILGYVCSRAVLRLNNITDTVSYTLRRFHNLDYESINVLINSSDVANPATNLESALTYLTRWITLFNRLEGSFRYAIKESQREELMASGSNFIFPSTSLLKHFVVVIDGNKTRTRDWREFSSSLAN